MLTKLHIILKTAFMVMVEDDLEHINEKGHKAKHCNEERDSETNREWS
jgi:hypothetical protein